jgi:hypothetical protein
MRCTDLLTDMLALQMLRCRQEAAMLRVQKEMQENEAKQTALASAELRAQVEKLERELNKSKLDMAALQVRTRLDGSRHASLRDK